MRLHASMCASARNAPRRSWTRRRWWRPCGWRGGRRCHPEVATEGGLEGMCENDADVILRGSHRKHLRIKGQGFFAALTKRSMLRILRGSLRELLRMTEYLAARWPQNDCGRAVFLCRFAKALMCSQSPRMSASFFARLQPFICRSAAMASVARSKCWDQTSMMGRREKV